VGFEGITFCNGRGVEKKGGRSVSLREEGRRREIEKGRGSELTKFALSALGRG
jgi:hypothetical protein